MTTIRRTAKFTASVEAAKIAALLGGAPVQPVAAPVKATKAEKEQREVLVLKRAEVKRASSSGYAVSPGDVVCLIRNGGGRVYVVTLRRNKQHSCTCEGNAKWHKRCYHIDHCASEENARFAKAKAAIEAEQAMIAKATQENKVVEAKAEIAASLPEELCGIGKGFTVKGPVLPRIGVAKKEASDRELAELAIEAEVAAAAPVPTSMQRYRRRKAKEAKAARAQRAEMLYESEEIKERAAASESAERSMETAVLNGSSQGFNMYR